MKNTAYQSWAIAIFLLIPSIFITSILSIAGNPSDGIRLGLLSLPGVWLLYIAKKKASKPWLTATIVWWLFFWTDALLRSASWIVFKSDTDAHFIIQAIANTTQQESVEFLTFYRTFIVYGVLTIFTLCIAYFYIFSKLSIQNLPNQRPIKYFFIFIATVCVINYAVRPSRALHPVLYWTQYYDNIQKFKNEIKNHKHVHEDWLQTANDNLSDTQLNAKQTHVLIISESITSKNLGVCGYERNTTPELQRHINTFKIFCNAYSPAASTIDSMKMLLTEAKSSRQSQYSRESVLAYARAAGFKTYWISNQNDSYLSSLFGSFTHQQYYANHRSGRSSASLDESLLPTYQQVLQDDSPKKLIIVHLIGSHPNYELRYPPNFSKFNTDSDDPVETKLTQNGIGFWVQNQRNHYDNSILYQDWLINRFFTTFKDTDSNSFRSFMFVSDHGNEVGHELDFAGHSPKTQSGYQVPLILWYDGMKNSGVDLDTKINTADVDTSLMALMGLNEKDERHPADFTHQNYLFKPSSAWPYWKQ